MTVEERLARILSHSGQEYTVADILQKVEAKQLHLFEYLGTLLLLEVQEFPQKRVLHVWGMEGDGTLSNLPLIVDWVKALATSLACVELRCQGRSGWEKALRPLGAVPLYTTLVMELS